MRGGLNGWLTQIDGALRKRYPRYYDLFTREVACWRTVDVPLRTRVNLWRQGFLSDAQTIYDFERNRPALYLSDFARDIRAPRINRRRQDVLDNKRRFREALAAIGSGHLVPENYAIIEAGAASRLSDGAVMPLATFLREQLSASPRLIVKPLGGSLGAGIMRIEQHGGLIVMNGEQVPDWDALAERMPASVRLLAVEFVEQAAYANAIFPHATNTIRLLTMPDVTGDGDPFVAMAAHRFGTTRTAPVDNWAQGGMSVMVDTASGELGAAVVFNPGAALGRCTDHPDTGARITGVRIPGWPGVVAGTLAVARGLRDRVPYVGWDVVVTDGGFRIIEGNWNSGVHVLQVHRPLLEDPRVRAFYRAHGVI